MLRLMSALDIPRDEQVTLRVKATPTPRRRTPAGYEAAAAVRMLGEAIAPGPVQAGALRPASPGPDPGNTLSNLPAEVSSFVGRERELRELTALLPHTRLLTLTGPGHR